MKEYYFSSRQVKRRTYGSFLFFIIAMALGVYAWKTLRREPQDKGIPVTLRKGLLYNESIFASASPKLIRTYPVSQAAKKVRVNGNLGLRDQTIDTASWRLKWLKANGDTLYFSLNDLMKIKKTEVVFDFKCIEGWSQKTWWGGVKVADFIKYYHLEPDVQQEYASLSTPDKAYYVGLDMPSFLHPQTLLCYEMNGAPLPLNQGYPLRLIIPVKYGIKHLKRIGTIYCSNQRPPDYWAERGYDFYSGH
ncbi:MAG TPA: molybdopterin-dependent oxidoreductase [Flavisolibacter sp.]|jgi:DMSO/TMAO reductase YedYZ molybdopterin-dependent catalytic subunit|nr:molybdopterin-dependent oxidoreductase [Flavisolibacter sp.]